MPDTAFLTLWREADSWRGEKGRQELGNRCQQSKRQRGEDRKRKDEASLAESRRAAQQVGGARQSMH